MAHLKQIYLHAIVSSILVLLCISLKCIDGHETDLRKELLLNGTEKAVFAKFKSEVWKNISNARGFIKTDVYLVRWIRAKEFNVTLAVGDMFDCLEWRKVNKLDTILNEDWSDMVSDYPYTLSTLDLQGRPVIMGSIGKHWKVSRGVMQGKLSRMSRYIFKALEESFHRLYKINQKHQNITQFSGIANLAEFSVFQQGCPVCMSWYVQLLTRYNQCYPNFIHGVFAINTPSTFKFVLDLIKPMLNEETNEALQVFGKSKWRAALDKEVSRKQRTPEFGGTRRNWI